jgi:hypothetical protein
MLKNGIENLLVHSVNRELGMLLKICEGTGE